MPKILNNTIIFILFAVAGFVIFIISYIYFFHQPVEIKNLLIPVSHFSFENPPTESLRGKISSISGNVAWESRTSVMAKLINSPIEVGQGETITTQGNGSVSIVFPKGVFIQMAPNSDAGLIQTLPVSMVISQNQGSVTYDNPENKIPLSIIGLDLLITLDKGSCTVTMDNDNFLINVLVSSGSVTIAYTDNENNTQTQIVESGNEIEFNNNAKRVRLKPLE